MSFDIVVLTSAQPDREVLALALAAGAAHRVARTGTGTLEVIADDGRPLVAVSPPERSTRGEAARLLGPVPALGDGVLWWTEMRACTADYLAATTARAIAGHMVETMGGHIWSSGSWSPWSHHADGSDVTPTGTPAGAAAVAKSPTVDRLTHDAAVILQDRAVVGVSRWLQDSVRAAFETDPPRQVDLITPADTRITLPLHDLLTVGAVRWLLPFGDLFYDGLTGAVVDWAADRPHDPRLSKPDSWRTVRGPDGTPVTASAFTAESAGPLGALAAPVRQSPPGGLRLSLQATTAAEATDHCLLGASTELAWRCLTGDTPASWGTAEPAGNPWSRQDLTRTLRARLPLPTWAVLMGSGTPAATATVRVATLGTHLVEELTLHVDLPADGQPPSGDTLRELAGDLSPLGLRTLVVAMGVRSGHLTAPPRRRPATVPLAVAVGSADRGRFPPGGFPGLDGAATGSTAGEHGGAVLVLPGRHADWAEVERFLRAARRSAGGTA